MYSARDNKGHLKVCLTLIFKGNCGVQVTNVSHFEIPNIGYVQIGSKNDPISRIQPVINNGVSISNSDLDFQGHPLRSSEEF